ncbi:TonB-dependent receptor [Marinihelvus fidelis]|uniref:TonB-dependent receptor n=1 Tax=Marinihelvus fidelis TaxID=2613842 RepID=A0A5N0TCK8_9GAMM|nr:TonB-dependent receptor [Marinihelvus fidelis]KAA9132735.1 TonB-dependent receptor [Marinihelvus fidelis]
MNTRITTCAALAASLLPCTPLLAQPSTSSGTGHDTVLEEIIVTAEFRPVSALDTAASVSVFGEHAIETRGAVHVEQLLNLAPNVNFSAGASRGRYFQVRGIGERSQFVEPINPSVGLVIDGMDFTGIGGAATTMDLAQVEILRGPQGTLFGANALAGMIHMVSNAPGAEFGGSAEFTYGNFDRLTVGAAVGGPAGDTVSWRLAAQVNRADGWYDNTYLGRPTNDIDEGFARGRLAWAVSDDIDLGLVLFLADIDNGYDAFSLDNTLETLSDEPGQDTLEATGLAVNADWRLNDSLDLQAALSHVDADAVYSYDEDWSHTGICDGTACDSEDWGFDWWYSSFDAYTRNNRNTAADVRLLGEAGRVNWTTGAYYRDQQQGLQRDYTYAAGRFDSQFDSRNAALYGQLDFAMAERWTLVTGLRWETRDWDYADNTPTADDDGDESYWGGRLALEYRTDAGTLFYALVSRGYKPGGYNAALAAELPDLEAMGIEVPEGALVFDGETLLNYEAGIKGLFLDDQLRLAASAFYQDRDDVQVKQSIVIPDDPAASACPCVFIDSLQNAAGGVNYGLELEADWQLAARWRLFGTLGLLRTEYRDFLSYTHADADPENGVPYDMGGRDQAHAPRYQYTVGIEFEPASDWLVQADIEGKDRFYASASHDERTAAYALINLRVSWQLGDWRLSAWGRNLADEDVQVRGFGGFGNDPRKLYEVEPYFQLGEPRAYGLTATWTY